MGAGAGAAGAAAAAAAAKKRREQRREEEQMTRYEPTDLNGWEFKIVRSASGKFKNRETVEKVRREESEAGWELVEKFDNNRMRFKRRIENRSKDQYLKIDPYRTTYGMGEGTMALLIVTIVFAVTGIALLVALSLK